jgi:hypothetical protein
LGNLFLKLCDINIFYLLNDKWFDFFTRVVDLSIQWSIYRSYQSINQFHVVSIQKLGLDVNLVGFYQFVPVYGFNDRVGTFLGANHSKEPAAVLSGQARTVRGAGPDGPRPGTRLGFPAWWPDGPRPRAGRSATWRQGRLPPPCWNLDLVPWGEKILRCSGSTGHPGRPQMTWSRLGIKRSIRGRGLGWTTRSCPSGGVRS